MPNTPGIAALDAVFARLKNEAEKASLLHANGQTQARVVTAWPDGDNNVAAYALCVVWVTRVDAVYKPCDKAGQPIEVADLRLHKLHALGTGGAKQDTREIDFAHVPPAVPAVSLLFVVSDGSIFNQPIFEALNVNLDATTAVTTQNAQERALNLVRGAFAREHGYAPAGSCVPRP